MIKKVLQLLLTLYIFFLSIELMGGTFLHLGKGSVSSIIAITSNPFISFFIGLLATTLIQSSSTTTSLVVAAVATESISIYGAVPMIMGANIGTTLTSTIVSLGYITNRKEFRKAISAGTIHDFFNILATIIFLPLEITYSFLSRLSIYISEHLLPAEFISNDPSPSLFDLRFAPFTEGIVNFIDNSVILFVISFGLLFGSIKLLSGYIYKIIIGKQENKLANYFFGHPIKSFGWGLLVTAGIQSSSISSSLIVPLVATSRIRLKQAFYFVMGANVGTTITALIAAIFKSQNAFGIAITHLIFNLFAATLFITLPFLRYMVLYAASKFGKVTSRLRFVGFVYILLIFFLIPFLLIYIYRLI